MKSTERVRRVALVGTSHFSRHAAPYGNPEWEVWGLAGLWKEYGPFTRFFEMHKPERIQEILPDLWAWMTRQRKLPIVMQEVHPDVKTSVRYPVERMVERFGRYFTSTAAYMLALAVDEGFEEVSLFGFDLDIGSEYTGQKPCVEYFIGLARGLGVTVNVHPTSSLLQSDHLYGYESGLVRTPGFDQARLVNATLNDPRSKTTLQLGNVPMTVPRKVLERRAAQWGIKSLAPVAAEETSSPAG